MNEITRRGLLTALLGGAASVVLARVALAGEDAPAEPAGPAEDVQSRADRLAEAAPPGADGLEPVAFLNHAFRNSAFRNGGFANGGFRNNAFRNGGFANGGFRNGAFRNW